MIRDRERSRLDREPFIPRRFLPRHLQAQPSLGGRCLGPESGSSASSGRRTPERARDGPRNRLEQIERATFVVGSCDRSASTQELQTFQRLGLRREVLGCRGPLTPSAWVSLDDRKSVQFSTLLTSSETVSTQLPSGLKTALLTAWVWPWRVAIEYLIGDDSTIGIAASAAREDSGT